MSGFFCSKNQAVCTSGRGVVDEPWIDPIRPGHQVFPRDAVQVKDTILVCTFYFEVLINSTYGKKQNIIFQYIYHYNIRYIQEYNIKTHF